MRETYSLHIIAKYTITLILTCFLSVIFSKTYAFNNGSNQLSLNLQNASLKEYFEEIEKQTDFVFFFQESDLEQPYSRTFEENGLTISRAMSILLFDTNLGFKIVDSYIVVKKKADFEKTASNKTLTQQQKRIISGVIKDEGGIGLPGVNIIIQGTSHGTTSNLDGEYELEVDGGNIVLNYTFVGYQSIQKVVGTKNRIDITMIEDVEALEEVIVVGYGIQKKSHVSGAISKMEGEEMATITNGNTAKSLQGLSSGITVMDRGGVPGDDDPQIFLRGVGTNGNAQPLVLVDGIEMRMNEVPASDIESISVLKDAAAAAIYGSRAAHGVILVTTKRGATGDMKVSYSGYAGIQDRAIKPKHVGPRDYMSMVNEAAINAGNSPIYSDSQITRTENGELPFYNYTDQAYKPTHIQEHTVNVSGGQENGKFLLSMNYLDQPALTENAGYKRYNLRLNTDFKVGERFDIGADISYRHMDRKMSSDAANGQGTVWSMNPTVPIRYDNGAYALDGQNNNPIASFDQSIAGQDIYQKDEALAQVKASYKLAEGLSIKSVAAFNGAFDRRKIHLPTHNFVDENNNPTGYMWNPQSSIEDQRNNSYQTTLRAMMTYNKNFGRNHSFSALAGAEQIAYRNYYSSAMRKNLISDNLPDVGLGDDAMQYAYGLPTQWGINSYFGRINYAFKDRYLFEMNVRSDGSSRFSEGNKWGVFPSLSAAWRISEESFMDNLTVISDMKIRGSWGQMGNERIGEFMYLPQYIASGHPIDGQLATGIYQSQMANPDITWEKVELTNIGVDTYLFDNKISVEVEYYIKDTRDILMTLPIPDYVGLTPPQQNAGVIRNSGVELNLGYRKSEGDFRFSTVANLSFNKNQWIDLGGEEEFIDGRIIQTLGQPINSFYLFPTDGLIANEADLEAYKAQNSSDPRGIDNLKPGDIKFVDTNGDGVIDEKDRQVYSPNIPNVTFGLTVNMEYKNWDLSLFFQGAAGGNTYIYGEFYEGPSYESFTGIHFLDRWTPENQNPNASAPRLEQASSTNFQIANDYFLRSTSYLKLKNAQIGYNVPQPALDKLNIEKMRWYVSGTNLFTLSSLPQGIDPEGFEGRLNSYPTTMAVTIGTNITF